MYIERSGDLTEAERAYQEKPSFTPAKLWRGPAGLATCAGIAASGKPSTWLPLGDLVEQATSENQFESVYVDSGDFIRVASPFPVSDAESL